MKFSAALPGSLESAVTQLEKQLTDEQAKEGVDKVKASSSNPEGSLKKKKIK